ncbi:MAG: DUF697 domain-containing protein [Eggerthellaceae bacterium]|nr:DUF697 domain-containing protein [Eggerthellaceae bacterium]
MPNERTPRHAAEEPGHESDWDRTLPLAQDEQGSDTPALPASEDTAAAVATAAQFSYSQKRTPKTGTYVILACVIALLALSLLGSLMNVGDHLMAAHPALGWLFYGLIVALVVAGIIVPVVKVAKRPIFSLYQLHDETGHAKQRRCRMLVDNLVANTPLTDQEIAELQKYLQAGDRADDLLIAFFNEHCTPLIDEQTKHAATTAFLISAISHSPLISTVTMLSICLDLVRSIVETCGFRPTNLGLARLYTRVVISALIIGGIEDADLSDLLGQLMGGGAGARAGGFFLGSAAEGLVSAFLVFRVGVITKKWLTTADGPVRMSAIRRTSYREALAMMRTSGFMTTVADTVKETSASVASSMATSVVDAAKTSMEQAKSRGRSTVDQAYSQARSTMEQARSSMEHTMEQARTSVEHTVESAKEAFSPTWGRRE